jgi:hypothetical protein
VGLIAEGVAGLSGGGAVIAPAVGLDDQSQARPVEVDLEAVDHLLRERSGKTGLGGDRAEENFELGI